MENITQPCMKPLKIKGESIQWAPKMFGTKTFLLIWLCTLLD
uniref:Uncharacterized protein n=1 Tax=Anguilla anguilla TaxID=7936 RepID=A0A0E9PGB1_ANGAN